MTNELWGRFIREYIKGEQEYGVLTSVNSRLYDAVNFDLHCIMFPKGIFEQHCEPRWELVPDEVWEVLQEISDEFAIIRVLVI